MAQKSLHLHGADYTIGYEIVHPESTRTIVFLHGWGANRALMKQAFGTMLPHWRHIYVDLPGFGTSTALAAMDSYGYAHVMRAFLERIGIENDVLIAGHSFGGKVALLLAPTHLVLLSSAGIVWQKPFRIKASIWLAKRFNALGLGFMRSLFSARDAKGLDLVMYDTFKRVVDEDMSEAFRNYRGRALLCWGEGDSATPLKSAHKIAGLIDDHALKTYDGDHYFFMKHAATVAHDIESFYDKGAS